MSALNWGFREFKAGFFDREKVQDAVEAGRRKALSKFGSFVRQRAKSSIRKRKAISAPGMPPSSHEGSLRLIFFAYDKETQSEVIGPVKFKRGRAPDVLEHGGVSTVGGKTAIYQPRPFMKPAGDAEYPRFKSLIRSMVK